MSDFTLWIARILGVFYLAGGVMVLRTMLESETMDGMLRVLERRSASLHERTRLALLGTGAVLTAMAGSALLLDSVLALPLFLVNGLVQAVWLLYARGAFPPEDDAEALGRRRTGNAFLGWIGVTALVGWLAYDGRLVAATDPMRLAVVATLGVGLSTWYLLRHRRLAVDGSALSGDDPMPPVDSTDPDLADPDPAERPDLDDESEPTTSPASEPDPDTRPHPDTRPDPTR